MWRNMSKFVFKMREQRLQIEDLGESMNSQFLRLHESHFFGRDFDLTMFRNEALIFLITAMAITTLMLDFLIISPLSGGPSQIKGVLKAQNISGTGL